MKRFMAGALAVAAAAAVGTVTYVFVAPGDPSAGTAPTLAGAPPGMPLLQRGEYLTKAADCVACHTAPQGKPFAGGLAFKLPFGRIFSTNLTPDRETGLGAWSDDDFVRALQTGVGKDGQRLYPVFPYTAYTQLSRDDLLAIKAYLMSLPPVAQPTPQAELNFPFNQRWGMAFWNAVFFKNERFTADASQSEAWNRGAYLAQGLGHCAECHTPRNAAFALDHRKELAGASLEGWVAPNITSDRTYGVGAWTDQELLDYLQRGHASGRGSAGGPMAEAVSRSLQHLQPEDLRAMVTYLRSVPPVTGDPATVIAATPASVRESSAIGPAPNTPEDLRAGLRLFESSCAGCHRWDGAGRQLPQAALLQLRSVNDPTGQTLTKMILDGVSVRVSGTDVVMPGFKHSMSDVEVAQLSNYVIQHFSGKQGKVTAAAVARQRLQ